MKLLYFILLFIPATLSAQPYESMFGRQSTQWLIEWRNLSIGGVDTLVVDKDTLVNGAIWKKIKSINQYTFFQGALLKEDTMTGKVWYKGFECNDTAVKLAFDFSLSVGDTFDISNAWKTSYSVSDKIVDSVFFENGRKYIRFRGYAFYYESMIFMEGIGGVMGITYKQFCSLMMAPYLMCAYKDGVKIYSNKQHNGICWLGPYTGINDPSSLDGFTFYPNPVDRILHLKYPGNHVADQIELIDRNGRIIFRSQYNPTINLRQLSSGIYFLRLTTRKGKVLHRTILKK